MLGLTRNSAFRVSLPNTLIQQIDRLHISAVTSPFFNASSSKSSIGFSCASPNSTLLNVSNGKKVPIFEQRRFRGLFKEWTWNYKHKHWREYVHRPYFKWDYSQLENEEYTHKPFKLRRLEGRDPVTKHKVNQRIGGGFNFDYFWIDFRRNRFSSTEGGCYEERILEVRRAPNETAFVALAAGSHGRRWILATENMKAGDVVRSYNYIPTKMLKDYEMPEGDSWPVGALPPGTTVCNVQEHQDADYSLSNYKRDYRATRAGASATIVRQQGEFTVVQIRKDLELAIKRECIAVIGRLSNVEHDDLHWGSMNMKRRWGIRQGSGVWHKKDGYCGRKGHPLKRITIDPEKADPPPIKIPITLTPKDFQSRFGTAASMPQLYQTSPEDNFELP